MIYISNLSKITNEKFYIGCIHYMPFDDKYGLGKSKEELEKEGVLIEELPEKEYKTDKTSVLYWNPVKKEVFYEYKNIEHKDEKYEENEKDQIKDRLSALEKSNGEMMALITTLAMPKM